MTLRGMTARRARPGAFMVFLLLCWSWNLRSSYADDAEPPAVAWRHDYAEALREARSQQRLLWIQFTGSWCPSCARMERDSFSDPTIRRRTQQSFVPVKLQADENQELALRFELTGLPATVIVAPSLQVVVVRQGYLGPEDLKQLLTSAIDKHASEPAAPTLLTGAGDAKQAQRNAADSSAPRPRIETDIALSGYCPVSLVSDKRLVQGQTEYTVTHEGRLYRFANLITFNLFRGDPSRYVPVNNGNCPVAQIDRGIQHAGNPRYGVLFQDRLYLCASVEDRRRFLKQPERYAAVDLAESGNCPHCLASEGAQVPGDPRIDLRLEGRRYLFPDASHRKAYLAGIARETSRR